MPLKPHPWKACSRGEVFVQSHKKTINGKEYKWSSHCRKVKFKKHILNKDEILEIEKKFDPLKLKMPKTYGFSALSGNKYDLQIAGWVKFWSDTLGQVKAISPDFVKTLIMSESSFKTSAKATTHDRPGLAIGLMQITTYTHKLIHPAQKKLSDHTFKLSKKDLYDSNVNICVGVRWLFRKHQIAKHFLKKEPTELQLAEEFKGIRNDKSIKADKIRKKFLELLKELNYEKK